MTVPLRVLDPKEVELHTTELTTSCDRQAWHRSQGEYTPEVPTAMFRGMVAGEAGQLLHVAQSMGKDPDPEAAVDLAAETTDKIIEDEGRIKTEKVASKEGRAEILAEIVRVMTAYSIRIMPLFRGCTLLGTEIPIRANFGHGINFASHLDIAFLDDGNNTLVERNGLIIPDFKWTDQTPTHHFLARYEQFICYWLACKFGAIRRGEMRVGEAHTEGEWWKPGVFPHMAWVHLPALKPYGRATEAKDDNGEVRTFKKGELRPLRQVIKWAPFDPKAGPGALKEIQDRVAMRRAGFWPQRPDKIGCFLCSSEKWCTRFDVPVARSDDDSKSE